MSFELKTKLPEDSQTRNWRYSHNGHVAKFVLACLSPADKGANIRYGVEDVPE